MARLAAGELFHIVNDHLGTPKEMFSEGGDLAWSVDHDTWGTVRRVAGAKQAVRRGDYWVENVAYSVSEAAEPAALLCPIRFQGQWEDAEPWGFSMSKTDSGFSFGFNSIAINEILRGRPGDNTAPQSVWQKIMDATGQDNCKPRGV